MAFVSWLRDNISSKKVEFYPARDSQPILLKEKDKNVNMTVEIVGIRNPVATIRLDKVQHHSSIRSSGNLKRVCDYLLVTQAGDKCHAIFVELKKTLNEESNPREQLRRSPPLFDYFLSIFDIDSGLRSVDSKVEVSYFLIGHQWNKYIDKQSVKVDPGSNFVEEEYESITIRKIVALAISFDDLLKG